VRPVACDNQRKRGTALLCAAVWACPHWGSKHLSMDSVATAAVIATAAAAAVAAAGEEDAMGGERLAFTGRPGTRIVV